MWASEIYWRVCAFRWLLMCASLLTSVCLSRAQRERKARGGWVDLLALRWVSHFSLALKYTPSAWCDQRSVRSHARLGGGSGYSVITLKKNWSAPNGVQIKYIQVVVCHPVIKTKKKAFGLWVHSWGRGHIEPSRFYSSFKHESAEVLVM